MDDKNQQTGQQGYGQNEDPTKPGNEQQPSAQERNGQPLGGNDSGTGTGTTMTSGTSTGDAGAMETGQAAYGNSGQADLSQQEGQSASGQTAGTGNSSGFIGSGNSGNDMGSSGQHQDSVSSDATSGSVQQDGSSEQDFAEQGQGALDSETLQGRSSQTPHEGTDDIEIERSQNREPGSNNAN